MSTAWAEGPRTGHQLLPWGPEVRPILYARCRGRCELCGDQLGDVWDAHHRQHRSRGGPDCPCNGAALHPGCHTLGPNAVHVRVRLATESGHNVSRYDDPRLTAMEVPQRVHLLAGGPVLLSCGGTYQ
jgi:hypothetical protein